MLGSYTPKVGATFTRNNSYWGTKALPSQTQFTFYDTQPPSILALTGGTIDVLGQFSVIGGEALLGGSYNIIKLKSSAHRELSMRNDQAPFTDPRVRQAIALTLNRPQIITALFKGLADIGNDSPFAPVFPSTNTSVAQRAQNISQAKSLLAAAGHPSGFTTSLVTENIQEIPTFAQIVAQSAAAIGVKINLNVEAQSKYYGNFEFGTSDWLDGTMSLVDYGHRGVPNVFLGAPLETINTKTGTGAWNAARFNNSQYDSLVAQYVAAAGPDHAAHHRRADREAAAQRDADHLRVLLQLPDGDNDGRHRCVPDRDRASVPVQRGEELTVICPCAVRLRGAQHKGVRPRSSAARGVRRGDGGRQSAWRPTTERAPTPTGMRAGITTGTCRGGGCARRCSGRWTGW